VLNHFADLSTGFDAANGVTVTQASPEGARIEWTVEAHHLQPAGIVHGGVYCAAVETAASIGAHFWLGERGHVVGVSNHTDFLRAVTQGRLSAQSSPIHRGRSQQLWGVEVTDEDGRLVARGQVRLQNLDPR
jgi:uncharacterized protein (TIGR00369 family)